MTAFNKEFAHVFTIGSISHQIVNDNQTRISFVDERVVVSIFRYSMYEYNILYRLLHFTEQRLPSLVTPYDPLRWWIDHGLCMCQQLVHPTRFSTRCGPTQKLNGCCKTTCSGDGGGGGGVSGGGGGCRGGGGGCGGGGGSGGSCGGGGYA